MPLDLKYFIRMIRKRLLIFILLPMAAAFLSAFISFFMIHPEYESSMTLYLINKKSGYTVSDTYDVLISRQLLKDFSEILKSRRNMDELIENLDLGSYTPAELGKKLDIRFRGDTNIVEIKVRAGSPVTAEMIAARAGEMFRAKLSQFTGLFDVEIINEVDVSGNAVSPRPLFNTAVAFFAGLLAVTGIIIFLEYIDDTFKTQEDVEKHLGLTVLGSIPLIGLK